MLPLIMAPREELLTIEKVSGNEKLRKHLSDMGFVPGAEIVVLNQLAGNLIVNVKQSRVAIGKDMANRIKVNICCVERSVDDGDFKIYKGRRHRKGRKASRKGTCSEKTHGYGDNERGGSFCEKSCTFR